jgi:hypothetical protein
MIKPKNFILLAFSPTGIYVQASNKYAVTTLHYNTTTCEIHEISHHIQIDERARYVFSYKEIERISEYFISLLN